MNIEEENLVYSIMSEEICNLRFELKGGTFGNGLKNNIIHDIIYLYLNGGWMNDIDGIQLSGGKRSKRKEISSIFGNNTRIYPESCKTGNR